MICPNCQTENRDSAKYCDECGFPLHGKIAEVAAAASATRPSDDNDFGESIRSAVAKGEESLPEINLNAARTASLPKIVLEPEPAAEQAPAAEPNTKEQAIPAAMGGAGAAVAVAAATGPEASTEAPVAMQTETLVDSIPFDKPKENYGDDFSGLDESIFGMPLSDTYAQGQRGNSASAQSASWREGATLEMPKIESDDSNAAATNFRAPSNKKKPMTKKTKTTIAIVIAVVVVIAALAGITYALELWGGKSVPNVCGMTQAEATQTLEAQGFTVRTTQVKSDETEGKVLVMDPSAGSRVGQGNEVVIHISTLRSIPNIVGKTEAEAKKLIEAEGLENVTYVTKNSSQPEGTVLSVSPEAGTTAKLKTQVTVTVAAPFKVPDVANMTLDQAYAAITDAGLTPYVVNVDDDSKTEGTILGTTPAASTIVNEGSEVGVQVVVHRSSELIAATRNLIYTGATLTINGTNYYVTSLDDVAYLGNDRTSFTMTASAYVYLLGEMVMGSPKSISGTIQWTSSNTVQSIS